MAIEGSNTIVLDIETLRSADDCRDCGQTEALHHVVPQTLGLPLTGAKPAPCVAYSPIGWDEHAALGVSIAVWWDYRDMRLHFLDRHTLAVWMRLCVNRDPLLVSFNGLGFDVPLLCAVLREEAHAGPSTVYAESIDDLCRRFQDVAERGYDLLGAIWAADPDRKFERGLNGLGAVSQANGFGSKEMDGATAPRRWAQGRYAEVTEYCASDVYKTKALFELVLNKGGLFRGDRTWLALPRPVLREEASATSER